MNLFVKAKLKNMNRRMYPLEVFAEEIQKWDYHVVSLESGKIVIKKGKSFLPVYKIKSHNFLTNE